MRTIDNDLLQLIARLCGINADQQLEELFEAGCEYADLYNPTAAFTKRYWSWWIEEYQDVEMEFVMYAMCQRQDLRENKAGMATERVFIHQNRCPRLTVEINELLTV